jgi:hypothetical protein
MDLVETEDIYDYYLGATMLLHYFLFPSHGRNSVELRDRLPKVDHQMVKAHCQSMSPKYVGLQLVEEFTLLWVIIISCGIVLAAIAFACAWYAKTGDLGGAFTVAGCLMGSLVIVWGIAAIVVNFS